MVTTRPRGFTVVEVLVVIGIIAILASILFVGLRSALSTAAKTRELNSLRSISLAWQMYANGNGDHLLPGYVEPAVQDAWRVEWRNARREVIANQEATAPYTWRLAPYVEYSWDTMMGYRSWGTRDLFSMYDDDDDDYLLDGGVDEFIANRPAFGYNGIYIGGWWQTVELSGGGTLNAMRYDLLSDPQYRGIIARTSSQIRRPEHTVVFAASTERAPGPFVNSERGWGELGFHLATPRIVASEMRWNLFQGGLSGIGIDGSGGGSGGGGAGTSGGALTVNVAGPVPLARHTHAVAVATADGGVSALSVDELADQRRWIGAATDRDWSHPPK